MGVQFLNPVSTMFAKRCSLPSPQRYHRSQDPWHPMPDDFAAPLRAHYLAAITWTDRMVGRVLNALEESGEASRTIVTFTGDQ